MTQMHIQTVEARRRTAPEPTGEMAWVVEVEKQIAAVQPAVLQTLGKIERAIVLAKSIGVLRKALDERRMASIMELQGTPLGFRTDKDRNGGYDVGTVRECVIEAAIIGVDVVGNQFNIIAGRCYVTREGMSRVLRDWTGLTDLRINLGVPTGKGDGALVPFEASWMVGGVSDELKGIVPVRVNNGMGADAILGKADRKVKARIYSRISGSEFTHEGEVDDTTIDARAKDDTSDAIKRLAERQATHATPTPKESPSDPAAGASAGSQRSGTPGPDARREATGQAQSKEEPAPWNT